MADAGDDAPATVLAGAAGELLERAWRGGTDANRDAAAAADLYRRAADLSSRGSPARLAYLGNLALALRELWELSEDIGALDDAVSVLGMAAAESAADTRDGVRSRLHLGTALRDRFAAGRRDEDARAAIDVLTVVVVHAAAIEAPELAEGQQQLGNALFDVSDDRVDRIDESIRHLRAAAAAAPDVAAYASDLASALLARFDATSDAHALDEVVERLDQAAAREQPGAGPSARLLANLGNALAARATFLSSPDDASRAVAALRRASETASGTALAPAVGSDLAAGLLARFDITGQIADVDEGVDLLEAAVADTPAGDAHRGARLNNLAIALRRRALRRRGGRHDLDRAVAAYEEALAAPASARDRTSYHANLGNVLHQRFDVTGDSSDLDRAVEELEIAHAQSPVDSPDHVIYLNNLAATLSARADRLGDSDDLRRAAELVRDGLEGCPPASVNRPGMLVNLGNAASELFDRLGHADDYATAVDAYRSAAGAGVAANPADALSAARNWSEWAAGLRAWPDVIEAHTLGHVAAQRLFRAQIVRADKESWLRDADGLAAVAAFAYAAVRDWRAAVLALETGRGILLSERLQRDHADLRRLERSHSELALRYRAAVSQVDRLEGHATVLPR